MSAQQQPFHLRALGVVRRPHGAAGPVIIDIDEPFRPALLGLGEFSHVMVFWWANYLDSPEQRNIMQCQPPYAEGRTMGMFATRSPVRPNPIMMTTCPLLEVDQDKGIVTLGNLDAVDGTPVVDLKAYFPVCDMQPPARLQVSGLGWLEGMPDQGIGLEG